jgi:glycosyltransferase involved in cell wall biosynthesis
MINSVNPTANMQARVLYLTMNPNLASTTIPTVGWLSNLVPRGLKPVLATSNDGGFSRWVEDQGHPCYTLALTAPAWNESWAGFWSFLRLCRIVQKHRIQLIHCNEQNIYPMGAYLSKAMRIPVLVSIHFTMERGFCSWAFGKRTPDRVIFVSEGNLRNCLPSMEGIVDSSRFVVVNNGIDNNRNKPDENLRREFREKHNVGDAVALGVACALRPRKQVDHLVKAASLISGNIRVFVAGAAVPGDEDYAEKLISNSNELLGRRVTFLGHQQDLRPLLNGLDLFVNTSQEEACSISVIEALAHGCPVIGYPSKSVDCQILPGGGEITPQDDIQELSRCIQRWIDDDELRSRTSTTARNIAVNSFDMLGNCEQVWMLYNEILGKSAVG